MKKKEKKNYQRLLKLIGKDFLKLTSSQRMFMVKTAGIIKLPWISRFYTTKHFNPILMKKIQKYKTIITINEPEHLSFRGKIDDVAAGQIISYLALHGFKPLKPKKLAPSK